jgi:hypothetical protein
MIKITITIWEGNTDTNTITNIPLTETEENNTHCFLRYFNIGTLFEISIPNA